MQLGLAAQHLSGGLTGNLDEGDPLDGGRGEVAQNVRYEVGNFSVLMVAGQPGEHLLGTQPERPPAQDRLPAELEAAHPASLQEFGKGQQVEERREILLQEKYLAGWLYDHPALVRVGRGRARRSPGAGSASYPRAISPIWELVEHPLHACQSVRRKSNGDARAHQLQHVLLVAPVPTSPAAEWGQLGDPVRDRRKVQQEASARDDCSQQDDRGLL